MRSLLAWVLLAWVLVFSFTSRGPSSCSVCHVGTSVGLGPKSAVLKTRCWSGTEGKGTARAPVPRSRWVLCLPPCSAWRVPGPGVEAGAEERCQGLQGRPCRLLLSQGRHQESLLFPERLVLRRLKV